MIAMYRELYVAIFICKFKGDGGFNYGDFI